MLVKHLIAALQRQDLEAQVFFRLPETAIGYPVSAVERWKIDQPLDGIREPLKIVNLVVLKGGK